MAKNYNKMAIDIVREIGGEENVKSLSLIQFILNNFLRVLGSLFMQSQYTKCFTT